MRFSRVSRPHEVRMHDLRREEARTKAHRTGHVVQASTGRGLEAFMPPTFSQLADAFGRRQFRTEV